MSEVTTVKIGDFLNVTDYVANGSFASLKANVTYKKEPDFAVLVRLADHNSGWQGSRVYVDEAAYKFLKKSSVEPGDVIISNVGANAGSVFRAPDIGGPMTLGPNSVLIKPKTEAPYIRDYLYYYFASPIGQHLLQSILSGSAQPKFNKTDLRALEIQTPADGDYQSVVKLLVNIDDKIHGNGKLNQTLEQITQAFFKSWFVDFEPVKAKQHLRTLGGNDEQTERAAQVVIAGAVNLDVIAAATDLSVLDQQLIEALGEKLAHQTGSQREQLVTNASHFPDRIVKSELGLIPEGWGPVTTIGSLVELAYGKALKKANRQPGPYAVYGSGGVTGSHDTYLVNGPGVIVGRKGTVGSLYWEDDPFFPIDTVFYAKVDDDIPMAFVFYLFQTLGLTGMNTDAAVPGLNRNNVYRLEIPSYPGSLIAKFADLADCFRTQIRNNSLQSHALGALRDSLLPRLLSGEISVGRAA